MYHIVIQIQNANEYDQEVPQPHAADQRTARMATDYIELQRPCMRGFREGDRGPDPPPEESLK